MKKILLLILHCILACQLNASYSETKDFFVITIPKSGTHLIDRLINLMTGKNQNSACSIDNGRFGPYYFPGIDPDCHVSKQTIEGYFRYCKKNNKYCLSHTNFSKPFSLFLEDHPEYQPILQIRDLRDICVSLVAVYEKKIDRDLGYNATFDEKLLYIIQLTENSPNKVLSLFKYSQETLNWMNNPKVIVSKFEELVGEQGGGDKEKQIKLIQKIAESINVKLEKSHLQEIIDNLFGISKTFRKGMIGDWKTAFKEEHINAFKESPLGDLLIQMGYEKDNNW